MTLDDMLAPALEERRALSRYRSRLSVESAQQVVVRRENREFINFCSNDYLGLANHPKVAEAFAAGIQKFGTGSGASHLVCGHSSAHHELEEVLADFVGRPRALLFSSGYMANLGTINALVGRGDLVLEDKLNHASLLDGGLISGAKFQRFHHNDADNLLTRLQNSPAQRKLVVVDGVFSMDGDCSPLDKICASSGQANAYVMVDDAHGFGVLGESGKGTIEHFDLTQNDVPVLMATLGKAAGTFGAFVAGSEILIETLIQFSRNYIYTTAIPPAVAVASQKSIQILQEEGWRREHLSEQISYFQKLCGDAKIPVAKSATAIQPILLGEDKRAVQVAHHLEQKGLWISAIRPPTVPEGTARLRITLTANHQKHHIERLVECLHDILSS